MVATCLSAAIETLIMGLWANYPFALAPRMGLNAFFAFSIVLGMNIGWQVALTAVDGILFVLPTLTKFRETIVNEILETLNCNKCRNRLLYCFYWVCRIKDYHPGP